MADKEKMTRVFQMTPNTAETFFWIVRWSTDHGVKDTRKFRMYILDWLSKNGQMDSMYDTKRSEDQVVSDYQKHGFKVDDKRGWKKPTAWERFKRWIS